MAKNKKNYRKTELTGKNFTFDFNTFFFDFWSREKTKIQNIVLSTFSMVLTSKLLGPRKKSYYIISN